MFEYDIDAPKKKKVNDTQVAVLDLVESCFYLLRSNPSFYRNKWNWSVFIGKYLNFDNNKVKW